MGKTNYGKAEDEFEKGLHNIKVDRLLKKADVAQGNREEEGSELTPKQKMTIVDQEIKWMLKREPRLFKLLKLKRKKLEDLLASVQDNKHIPSESELAEIDSLKKNVHDFKNENFPKGSDEEILGSEIGRHVYKRHNVREHWLPMDTHADWNKHEKKKR